MRRVPARLTVLLICGGVIAAAIASPINHLPKIGDKLNTKEIPASASKNECATSPSQFYPCFWPKIDGIKYMIAFDKNSLLVKCITTNDPRFKTVDGYKVGDVIDVPESALERSPYWDIYAPKTRDGWRPIVGIDLGCGGDSNSKFDLCGDSFRAKNPGKAMIRGFSKGGVWSD